MNRTKEIIITACFLLLMLPQYVTGQKIIDRVLAVVEDEIILQSEVEMLAQMFAVQVKIDPRVEPEKYEEIRKHALNQLIEQYALLAKAIEDSIEIKEEEVDMVLDQQIKELIKQYGSEQEMVNTLGYSIRKIKEIYREDVRKKGMIDKLRQKKMQFVKITGKELEDFYKSYGDSLPEVPDQYEVSHILKTDPPDDKSRNVALEKAYKVLKEIRDGADFSGMAKKYSDDEITGPNGGIIGFVRKGDILKEFEDAAFGLEPGGVSDVVETQLGLHIIKTIEKTEESVSIQHILIKIEKTEEDETKIINFLQDLKKKIEGGESFEKLAKEFSDDPDVEKTSGKIGWLFLDNMPKETEEFKRIIPYLKTNEISEPFKTNYGYHIVRLEGFRKKHKMTIENDRELIERYAKTWKGNTGFVEFVEQAKKDVFIEIKEILE
ncbi:peptidylprolyl isomerase [candidate division KSB1 bacterium]